MNLVTNFLSDDRTKVIQMHCLLIEQENEDFRYRMQFRNELPSLDEVSMYFYMFSGRLVLKKNNTVKHHYLGI